ncbi:hypothetical protein [Nocardioides sp. GY 10127]|uniref:hypothetical protein n=1 Tax=Nocardioides sp. GY 10127 TaxID=2569762 RepID=UPI0010A91C98|nr:hypothetical protein [Nocardioides sp. GY 10127]TIC84061.1 hypothetical protein E8D37_04440 [Nocardioides sp. GY 10127]
MGKDKKGKKGKKAVKARVPKVKCCESRSKCGRCPLRMLKEGTLPDGYTVKRRKLVRVDGRTFSKKDLSRAA